MPVPWNRRRFLFDAGAGLWLAANANGFQQATSATVRIQILDRATKKPLAARIRLLDARGAEVTPLGRNAQPAKDAVEGDVRFQSRGYFYTDGSADGSLRRVPAAIHGPARLRVPDRGRHAHGRRGERRERRRSSCSGGRRSDATATTAATSIFTTSPRRRAGWKWRRKIWM